MSAVHNMLQVVSTVVGQVGLFNMARGQKESVGVPLIDRAVNSPLLILSPLVTSSLWHLLAPTDKGNHAVHVLLESTAPLFISSFVVRRLPVVVGLLLGAQETHKKTTYAVLAGMTAVLGIAGYCINEKLHTF